MGQRGEKLGGGNKGSRISGKSDRGLYFASRDLNGGGGSGLHVKGKIKLYSFCVFVCTSVSRDYTCLSYKWICGSAWLSKHISSTQLYFFF